MLRGSLGKILLVALALALVAAFFGFGLDRYLTLSFLKESREALATAYANAPARFVAGYFVLYVLVAALSLPGATVLTLAGGALFGFWITLAVVSFASTIGATAACALARTLFRQAIAARLTGKLKAIDEGIRREGAFYLFTLRLIPLFPFFVINAAMGLTAMPLKTFYAVSQLGMLPGTAVYVNAGAQLGRIDSLAGIVSPGLVVSFALLGLFPLAAKRAVALARARRARNARKGPTA
ncbi:MAG: TVP38/TMEM64 family protein [Solidesulfovibrio sp.]|uniref:TVP38/TMEM64 family protein n=1 Tax=Solidesulfovibrio sp. TaxID=2910990 RepID=UPI002B20B6BC|nr:TVP38/TMEM64 family protein [Solidesulfovibrio sp.]MEA4858411.1 TVP38/TMEM64 family protein [Solidesulfovibrio sp.]